MSDTEQSHSYVPTTLLGGGHSQNTRSLIHAELTKDQGGLHQTTQTSLSPLIPKVQPTGKSPKPHSTVQETKDQLQIPCAVLAAGYWLSIMQATNFSTVNVLHTKALGFGDGT